MLKTCWKDVNTEKITIAISKTWLIASVTHLTPVNFPKCTQVVSLLHRKWAETGWAEVHR